MSNKWGRGRTMPAEFFRRAAALRSPSKSYLSVTSTGSASTETSDAHAWNAVSIVDARTTTEAGVPIAMLPLPGCKSILHHHIRHMKDCRMIVVIVQPTTLECMRRLISNLTVNVVLVPHDSSESAIRIAEYYRSCRPYWDDDTVTVLWTADVILEHQFLWRAQADEHPTIRFRDTNGNVIATAWHDSEWATAKLGRFGADQIVHDVSWNMEYEYFSFISNTSTNPSW